MGVNYNPARTSYGIKKPKKKTIEHMSEAVARVYTVENRFKHGPSKMVETGC
jgi:hypothetical protein